MPANIYGARFYGHRQPAWHGVGNVSADEIGAAEAFQRVGPYDVKLDLHRGWSEIIRLPTPDDPGRCSFGRVEEDYELIAPAELTALWDESTKQPVETLGALDRGACLFITLRLGKYDVRGDPVINYMVLAHWMKSNRTSVAFVSPVRVVCMNTLMLAERMSSCRLELAPTAGVHQRAHRALEEALHRAEMQGYRLRKTFQKMADRVVDDSEAEQIAVAAYPRDRSLRRAALELFEGAGIGMDHPAARGTLWGMYNAVAELENFRGDGSSAEIAEDVLFGERAEVMRSAFKAALNLCDSAHRYATAPMETAAHAPEVALRR